MKDLLSHNNRAFLTVLNKSAKHLQSLLAEDGVSVSVHAIVPAHGNLTVEYHASKNTLSIKCSSVERIHEGAYLGRCKKDTGDIVRFVVLVDKNDKKNTNDNQIDHCGQATRSLKRCVS